LETKKLKLLAKTQVKVLKVEKNLNLNVLVAKQEFTSDSGFDQRGPPVCILW
jgi:hypothetical protein